MIIYIACFVAGIIFAVLANALIDLMIEYDSTSEPEEPLPDWYLELKAEEEMLDFGDPLLTDDQTCPHGDDPTECESCFQESDFRYDSMRERNAW